MHFRSKQKLAMKGKINFVVFFYLIFYFFLTSLSLGVFRLFKPYISVENNTSYLICEDKTRFEIGPNSIFALDNKLDKVNDQKARKLCQYKIIRDYGNIYQPVDNINYLFYPVMVEESSLITALFVAVLFFSLGALIIETVKQTIFGSTSLNIGKTLKELFIYLIS